MPKIVPLVSLASAMCFTLYGAVEMNRAGRAITKSLPDTPPASAPERRHGKPTEAGIRAAEPVHRSLIRFMNDLDDQLDTIHDAASFAAAKPKMIRRAREQA